MNRKIKLLNSKVKSKKPVQPQNLKYLCGFESNYELLEGLLILLNDDINKIEATSSRKECRYIYSLIDYVNKIVSLTYIEDTTPINKKLEKELVKIDSLLERVGDNVDLENFLFTLRNKVNRVLININKKQKQYIDSEVDEAKDLLFYALFEKKDYNNLHDMLLHFHQFDNIINNNIGEISTRLVDEYTKAILSGNREVSNYYYLIFTYFTGQDKYGFDKVTDEVVKRLGTIKLSIDALDLNDKQRLDLNNELSHLIRICLHDYASLETKYQINLNYSHDMLEEIDALKVRNYDNLYDFRDKYVMTIDGKSSNCYDDGCSFEILPNGNFLVGVYIADVGAYVKSGSLIDQYAYNLGQTIYVNNNILMLPDKIAIDKSSLNRSGVKHVHAHLFEITPQNTIVNIKVCNGLIEVKDRLTYTQVDSIVNSTSKNERAVALKGLVFFTQFLKRSNPKRLQYIKEKEKKKLDKKSHEKYQEGLGQDIVSELKVLTNMTLANYAFDSGCPFIYRVNVQHNKAEELKKIMSVVNGDPRFDEIIAILVAQYDDSYYSSTNLGHAGIGVRAYAHATTPLRNYSSMFNQRIIQRLIIDGNITDQEVYDLEKEVPTISSHLNERIIVDSQYHEESWKQKKKSLTK